MKLAASFALACRRLRCLLAIQFLLHASAFSLLGPRESWMDSSLSYGLDGSPGGPMNLGDEYRWCIPEIVYGFDASFVSYFGHSGIAAVESAVAILNDLPENIDLDRFPTYVFGFNRAAENLERVDLKSFALSALLEQLGVGPAEENVFCLRSRSVDTVTGGSYSVVNRNFDAYSILPTESINGVLFTYRIIELPAHAGVGIAPFPVDFSAPVSSTVSCFLPFATMLGEGRENGRFATALTRDDAAALRYIYSTNRIRWETLPSGFDWKESSGSKPVISGFRPGVVRPRFKRLFYNSATQANTRHDFVDRIVSGETVITQRVTRRIVTPDILFSAQDLGVTNLVRRTIGGWTRSNVLPGGDGAGTIEPGGRIVLNKVGPVYLVYPPGDQSSAMLMLPGFGTFDGTTNAVVTYPAAVVDQSIETLSFKRIPGENGKSLLNWTFRSAHGRSANVYKSTDLELWELTRMIKSSDGLFQLSLDEATAESTFYRTEISER